MPPPAGPRILIVDDDLVLLDALTAALKSRLHDAAIECQSSPLEALKEVRHGRYDVVLCDLRMPKQSGLEFLDQIKATDPDQPVVLITGAVDDAEVQEAKGRGADAILLKPFDRDHLVELIRSFIRDRREPCPSP